MDILVNIDVENTNTATQFYTRAFGLTVGRQFDQGFVELLGASSRIYLLQKAEGSAPIPRHDPVRSYDRHWTPVHLDFVVDNIEAAIQKAHDSGAIIESDIKTAKYGKIAYGSDPYGNGFCLIQFLGKGYDELISDTAGS